MGFWDKVGKVAGKALREEKEKIERTSKEIKNWDDERLIRHFKQERDMTKKYIYAQELQKRGYQRRSDE